MPSNPLSLALSRHRLRGLSLVHCPRIGTGCGPARSTTGLIGALALAALAGCEVGEAKLAAAADTGAATPVSVSTALAEIGDLFARYQATSNIVADGEAQVPARIDGQIVATLVEEGQQVVQGQLLARIDGERLRLEMRRSGAELDAQRGEYERQERLGERGLVSRASFENLAFDVAELHAAHAIDRYNYGLSEIRAPISGVIAARYVRTGEHVRNGDLAFRITDTSRLVARIKLPQRELSRIAAGQAATFTVAAYPGRSFDAAIARLSPIVDRTDGSITATAYIDNPDRRLAPGMFGRFDIQLERHPNALTIPARGIVEEDGQSIVYRVEDGRARRERIRVGVVAGARAEIVSGLDAGDEIVVSGDEALGDGTPVVTVSTLRQQAGS